MVVPRPKWEVAPEEAIGRFQIVVPPTGADHGNFAWVLDTATGDVAGYRFATRRNAKGEFIEVVRERMRDTEVVRGEK